jgi:hypothetical protein
VRPPAAGRGVDSSQALAELLVGGGVGAGAGGPHDDVAVGPGRLEADLAGSVEGAGVGELGPGPGQAGEGGREERPLPLEVGDDLVALRTGEGADLDQVGLGHAQQAGQPGAPLDGVGFQQGELGRGGLAGRLRLHRPRQLVVRDPRRRRARLDHHRTTQALFHSCHVVHVPPALRCGCEAASAASLRAALTSTASLLRNCRPHSCVAASERHWPPRRPCVAGIVPIVPACQTLRSDGATWSSTIRPRDPGLAGQATTPAGTSTRTGKTFARPCTARE